MSDEMKRAADELDEARRSYQSAEHNLAVARANLTRADHRFHAIWGKAVCNPLKAAHLAQQEGGGAG